MYRSRRYFRVLPLALAFFAVSACGGGGGGTEPEPREINLTIDSGNEQVGEPGLPLPAPIVVRVSTATGGAVEGQVVTFSVLAGGGSVSSSSVTSAADGRASVFWTLGDEPGMNSVRASIESMSATFQALGEIPDAVKGDAHAGLSGG